MLGGWTWCHQLHQYGARFHLPAIDTVGISITVGLFVFYRWVIVSACSTDRSILGQPVINVITRIMGLGIDPML